MQSGSYSCPGTGRIVYGTDCAEALAREIDGPATVRLLLDAAW